MAKRVYLVGHCSPDSSYLTMTVKAVSTGAVVERVNDDASLQQALDSTPDLLLINRQLDGMFDNPDGIELVRRLRPKYPNVRTMLVSNYPDAQAAAEEGGAYPGFGKINQSTPEAKERLKTALGL